MPTKEEVLQFMRSKGTPMNTTNFNRAQATLYANGPEAGDKPQNRARNASARGSAPGEAQRTGMSGFGRAFADSRARGEEEFQYNGGRYGTRMAGESEQAWRQGAQQRRNARSGVTREGAPAPLPGQQREQPPTQPTVTAPGAAQASTGLSWLDNVLATAGIGAAAAGGMYAGDRAGAYLQGRMQDPNAEYRTGRPVGGPAAPAPTVGSMADVDVPDPHAWQFNPADPRNRPAPTVTVGTDADLGIVPPQQIDPMAWQFDPNDPRNVRDMRSPATPGTMADVDVPSSQADDLRRLLAGATDRENAMSVINRILATTPEEYGRNGSLMQRQQEALNRVLQGVDPSQIQALRTDYPGVGEVLGYTPPPEAARARATRAMRGARVR